MRHLKQKEREMLEEIKRKEVIYIFQAFKVWIIVIKYKFRNNEKHKHIFEYEVWLIVWKNDIIYKINL